MNAFQPPTPGTVQPGLPYGIGNAGGQPDSQADTSMAEYAAQPRQLAGRDLPFDAVEGGGL